MKQLPEALAPLDHYRQFLLYKLVPKNDGTGKVDKIPVSPHTLRMYPRGGDWQNDPTACTDATTAIRLAADLGADHGVGFLFTERDPFVFIDIDGALTDGAWSQTAVDLCALFTGAAVEVSQSGTGLHIIAAATEVPAHGCKNSNLGLEMYHTGRFVALTGLHASGNAACDVTALLPAVVATYYPLSTGGDATHPEQWTTAPREGYGGPADDDELIPLMLRSGGGAASVFGGKASLSDLWHANPEALSRAYPDDYGSRAYDESKADGALAAHLAFWTGGDCERVERLMWCSGLVREKWVSNHSYLCKFTITKAVARCANVYTIDKKKQSPEERRTAQIVENVRIGEDIEEQTIPTIMSLDDMRRELVYIGDSGGVVHRVTGRVRKKEAAAGEYAASKHKWNDEAGKEKEAPAIKVWMALSDRATVDVLAWVPGESDICRPPEVVNGNTRAFNIWRGLRPLCSPDNWQELSKPFEQHIAYLVPIDEERRRFIQWLAHIVQHPEVLPHTCYLMITEQTGIGRNLLAAVMVRVLRGYVAAGVSLGAILDGKFNGRLSQKLLSVVDETREGMSDKRYVRGERLKGLITEEHRHIDTKYGLQTVEKNCCRWLMFSNHYDALPFENNDRRVIVIENPTQRQTPEYYASVYGLLDQVHFIGAVRRYLENVDLSDFNAGGHAPMNEAKRRALGSMMSETEKALIEFKEAWPGVIAGRGDIRSFVGLGVNETHLNHAIERAGMVNAGRRFNGFMGKDRAVIVHPDRITVEEVKAAAPDWLREHTQQARNAFGKT